MGFLVRETAFGVALTLLAFCLPSVHLAAYNHNCTTFNIYPEDVSDTYGRSYFNFGGTFRSYHGRLSQIHSSKIILDLELLFQRKSIYFIYMSNETSTKKFPYYMLVDGKKLDSLCPARRSWPISRKALYAVPWDPCNSHPSTPIADPSGTISWWLYSLIGFVVGISIGFLGIIVHSRWRQDRSMETPSAPRLEEVPVTASLVPANGVDMIQDLMDQTNHIYDDLDDPAKHIYEDLGQLADHPDDDLYEEPIRVVRPDYENVPNLPTKCMRNCMTPSNSV